MAKTLLKAFEGKAHVAHGQGHTFEEWAGEQGIKKSWMYALLQLARANRDLSEATSARVELIEVESRALRRKKELGPLVRTLRDMEEKGDPPEARQKKVREVVDEALKAFRAERKAKAASTNASHQARNESESSDTAYESARTVEDVMTVSDRSPTESEGEGRRVDLEERIYAVITAEEELMKGSPDDLEPEELRGLKVAAAELRVTHLTFTQWVGNYGAAE